MKDRPNKVRININVDPSDREKLISNAKQAKMTMTEFILQRCIGLETPQERAKKKPAKDPELEIMAIKLAALQTLLDREQKELEERKEELTEVRRKLDYTQNKLDNALAYIGAPFWAKWGKRKELPNR